MTTPLPPSHHTALATNFFRMCSRDEAERSTFPLMIELNRTFEPLVVANAETLDGLKVAVVRLFGLGGRFNLKISWAGGVNWDFPGPLNDDNFEAMMRLVRVRGSEDVVSVAAIGL